MACCRCCPCCSEPPPPPPNSPTPPPPPPTLNLQELWNLTVPSKDPKKPNRPKTVSFPELATYKDEFYNKTKEGIIMKVPTTGATTPNSKYPRCEFRELNKDGSLAAWQTDKGTHSMEVVTVVQKTTKNKPQICIAQIHDDKDDVCMVRYEDGKIIVSGNHFEKFEITTTKLNEEIDISISCRESIITIVVNGKSKALPPIKAKGCYFKAGNYLQSNESFDKNDEGIVLLKWLTVLHK